ncbi:MAG: MogA/MoaB family molybdenum cofactor biosynthesis protein [Candidatus Njordarchaeia archaeon]
MQHAHHHVSIERLKIGVYVVSTSRYVKSQQGDDVEDVSGDLAIQLLEEAGHELAFKRIIRDGVYSVKKALFDALRMDVDVIIFIGGTGPSKTDQTIDAVKPFMGKILEGFGELFRYLSYLDVGTISFLSRSLLGIVDGKAVVCLPGSPKAVELAFKKVLLPELGHVLGLAKRK